MLRTLFYIFLVISTLTLSVGGIAAYWGYNYVTRDLPNFDNIEEYKPAAVTEVYAGDGSVIAEFFEERRYPAKIDEIPVIIRNCFLAAEDASFYSHQGIDPMSIIRAAVKNFMAGSATQGGSTITQQVVKNLLLSPEKKLVRKAKEAILSYRLEKKLTKDEILQIYLNQIFFGNGAYGIKSAARTYFRKELSDLTLAEGALLAGLPKAPSRYSPVGHFKRAKQRQLYVLGQMLKAGFITAEQKTAAETEEIKVYPNSASNIFRAPYYVSEIRRIFAERWSTLNIDRDGLRIFTAVDPIADRVLTKSLQSGLRDVDKRRGWRGPLAHLDEKNREEFVKRYGSVAPGDIAVGELYPALIIGANPKTKEFKLFTGGGEISLPLAGTTWAKKRLMTDDSVRWLAFEQSAQIGDVIEISKKEEKNSKGEISQNWILDQTPEVEGAGVILDPFNGRVLSAVGGYSYKRSVFNRVTQSLRQPGSAFKPIVYLAAVDGFSYTPSTIVHDTPRTFRVGDEFWTPGNFDEKFLGPITLQVALEKSRNLVSVDILSRIGIDAVIQYARRLGIESKIGRNLSISLGSSEVTLLELSRAYGVFAAKGVFMPSVFISRIEDRFGHVIYDHEQESLQGARQAIDASTAFVMAHMMEGVVQRGTATKLLELARPVAGKTGTSNDQMDAWFIGYTPNLVCGVWVGFDQKKEIGDKETGGKVAAPVFLNAVGDYLKEKEAADYSQLVKDAKEQAEKLGIPYVEPAPFKPLDFEVPEGVEPFWVDKNSGLLSEEGAPGAILEYFKSGTTPPTSGFTEDTASYLDSPEL